MTPAHSIPGKMILHRGPLLAPAAATSAELDPRDIAYGLAGINRYGGQSRYTVASHSIVVSRVAERYGRTPDESLFLARWGLVHDASEYGFGDQIRPLKMLPGFDFAQSAHEKLTAVIGTWLGIGETMPVTIHTIDDAIISNEARALFPSRPPEWVLGEPVDDVEIVVHPAEVAERLWLERFYELWPERAVPVETRREEGIRLTDEQHALIVNACELVLLYRNPNMIDTVSGQTTTTTQFVRRMLAAFGIEAKVVEPPKKKRKAAAR